MVWQSEVTMQVLMHTTVTTHWPHHTTLPSMCVWRWHHACVVSQWWLHTNQWMNQASVLQCHQSQSQSCVCVAKVVLKWQWLPCHTHHDACDEPPIPTTHSSVCAQMVDMEVVVVLVMAMECDGAFMVTITTLVSCHSHSHTQ